MSATTIKISRAPNDPICMRASIGGQLGMGLYCTYRLGPHHETRTDIIAMLKMIITTMEHTEESEDDDDRWGQGKKEAFE
jgi:hypothetical protein